MTSNRWRRSAMTPALVIGLATLASLPLVACGGENANTVAAPPPAPPPPAPPPPMAPVASAAPAPSAAPEPPPPPPNPTGAEASEGQEHREHHDAGVLGLVTMSLKDLDLSADQQAKVEKIRGDVMTAGAPAKAAGKDVANLLADGVAAGKVDRVKTDAAIAKLVTQVQAAHDASLTSLNDLHATLTPPQRAKLVDEVQGHWEKWKEAHGKDEVDDKDKQHHDGYMLGLVRELGLSQDQADKIKAAFKDKMKAAPQEHAHKEVQDHLKAFGTAFKSDTFDAKKLAGGKAAATHMAKWGATRRARFLEAAASILTPDQRTKLAQTIRDHADKAPPA
jgi:Spy/CpxP family protein refolding chaperone